MREFYWITRLDALEGLFGFFIFLGVIGLAIYIGFRIYWNTPDCQDDETERNATNIVLKVSMWFALLLMVGIPGCVFVPNKEEALVIYGVGGSIEYIQEHPDSEQLPPNLKKAVDKFVEEYVDDKTNEQMR
jgi:hypothetical protein